MQMFFISKIEMVLIWEWCAPWSEAIVPPHQIQQHFTETSMELNAGMGDAAVISTVIQICIWLLHTCADVIINEPLLVHPRQRATLRPGLGFTERPQATLVGRVHGDFDAGSNVLTCNLLNACRKWPQWSYCRAFKEETGWYWELVLYWRSHLDQNYFNVSRKDEDMPDLDQERDVKAWHLNFTLSRSRSRSDTCWPTALWPKACSRQCLANNLTLDQVTLYRDRYWSLGMWQLLLTYGEHMVTVTTSRPLPRKTPSCFLLQLVSLFVFYMPYGILELKNTSFQTWWGVYR